MHLWAKQRPGVHAALAALLSALTSKAAALQDMLQRLVMSLLAATLAEPDPDTPLGAPAALTCLSMLLGAIWLLLHLASGWRPQACMMLHSIQAQRQ